MLHHKHQMLVPAKLWLPLTLQENDSCRPRSAGGAQSAATPVAVMLLSLTLPVLVMLTAWVQLMVAAAAAVIAAAQ